MPDSLNTSLDILRVFKEIESHVDLKLTALQQQIVSLSQSLDSQLESKLERLESKLVHVEDKSDGILMDFGKELRSVVHRQLEMNQQVEHQIFILSAALEEFKKQQIASQAMLEKISNIFRTKAVLRYIAYLVSSTVVAAGTIAGGYELVKGFMQWIK